jgi:hypothetical protein
VVTTDRAEAAAALARGEAVVVVVGPSDPPFLPAGPGRLGIYVGGAEGAVAMEAELFVKR